MIYITGDTHGRLNRIRDFCKDHPELNPSHDVMIILGDAGLNYYGGRRDAKLKRQVSRLPMTFFMLHGNHEQRPETLTGYLRLNRAKH